MYSYNQANVQGMFQSQTFIANKIDVQHTGIYDTITVAAGAALVTNTQFFTNVGSGSGKTVNQTNMSQSQRLPSPQAFSTCSIKLYPLGNILLTDLHALFSNFVYEFWLADKWYQRNPIWHYPAGGGVAGNTTTNATSFYTNGTPSREAMLALYIPLVIENGMSFYGQLVGTSSVTMTAAASGGTGLTLVNMLDGLFARGVQ